MSRFGTRRIDDLMRRPNQAVISAASFGTLLVDLDFSRSDLITLNSGKVSQINGAGGTTYNFANATGAQQPTWTQNDSNFNGHGTATFAGGQLLSSTSTITGGQSGITRYIVFSPSSVTGNQMLLECSTNGSNAVNSPYTNVAANGLELYVVGNDTSAHVSRRASSGNFSISGKYRVCHSCDLTSSNAHVSYVNGSVVGSNTTATYVTPGTMATQTWFLGARSGVAVPFSGSIARVIVYSGIHAASTVSSVDAYLRNLYG